MALIQLQTPSQPEKRMPNRLKDAPILSYGFRPFFLSGAIWAVVSLSLWIVSLTTGLPVGGEMGGMVWHMHEMLFGFGGAILAGFLLTAVPNWTGSPPLSGIPLLFLWGIWLSGRLALLAPSDWQVWVAMAIDVVFLPSLAIFLGRIILKARLWRNLVVVGLISALALCNLALHLATMGLFDINVVGKLAVSLYAVLVMVIGGRVIPNFTANWLRANGHPIQPKMFGPLDRAAILIGLATLLWWSFGWTSYILAVLALLACGLHLVRLARWQGWLTGKEPMVLVLHLAYLMIPLGFAMIAAEQFAVIASPATLHIWTIGVMGLMMLAIMTRAARGHTGHPLKSGLSTTLQYGLILAATLIRPWDGMADLPLLEISAICWVLGFGLYAIEYGPMLFQNRKEQRF